MAISHEWLNFLREQYPVGSRVRLNRMGPDEPYPVEPGSMGTLQYIDDMGTFGVKWDNGRGLGLVMGQDSFTVLPPELTVLKLYMPLTADLYVFDEGWNSRYGEDGDIETLEGQELAPYLHAVSAALESCRLPEEDFGDFFSVDH